MNYARADGEHDILRMVKPIKGHGPTCYKTWGLVRRGEGSRACTCGQNSLARRLRRMRQRTEEAS